MMDLRDFKSYTKSSMIYSDYLIRKYGLLFIPVSIIKVAIGEGLRVFEIEFQELQKNFTAYIKMDEKSIFVNTYLPIEKKRFAIAQQIGHYILSKDKNIQGSEKTEIIGLMDDSISTAINIFATNLLVPTLTLKLKIPEFRTAKYPQKLLAKEFKVTENIIHFKLSILNDLNKIQNEINSTERMNVEPITLEEERKLLMKVDAKVKKSIIAEFEKKGIIKKRKINNLFKNIDK